MLVHEGLHTRTIGPCQQHSAPLLPPNPAKASADQRHGQRLLIGLPAGRQGSLRRHQRLHLQGLSLLQGRGQRRLEAPLTLRAEFLTGGNRRLPGTKSQGSEGGWWTQTECTHGMGQQKGDQPPSAASPPTAPELPKPPTPEQLERGQSATAQPAAQASQGAIQGQNAASNTDPEQRRPLKQ